MTRDRVVVGGSLGGIDAVCRLLATLPQGFPAAVFVVIHVSAHRRSFLPEMLAKDSALRCSHATDGAKIEPGRVFVAPPDLHLVLEPTVMRLHRGPRENGHRPAVDPLFRSAARASGPRVVGVVVSGGLDCGTAGLHAIRSRKGVAVVQQPTEALCPDMPLSAIRNDVVDHIATISKMGPLLERLVRGRGPKRPAARGSRLGKRRPSGFGCPACGGVLWVVQDGMLTRLRRRVGHRYSPEGLEQDPLDQLDGALWASLRSLEENAALCRHLAALAARRKNALSARHFAEKAALAEDHARKVRAVLEVRALPPPD